MRLELKQARFVLRLSRLERLLALRPAHSIEIAVGNIARAWMGRPPLLAEGGLGLRINGLITAGTFLTSRGREFWWVRGDGICLVIDLHRESLVRVVLSVPDGSRWCRILAMTTTLRAVA